VQVLVDAFGGGVLPEFSECPAPLFLVHACRARQRLGAHILPTLTRHRGHSSTVSGTVVISVFGAGPALVGLRFKHTDLTRDNRVTINEQCCTD